jgi:hypothetical protein
MPPAVYAIAGKQVVAFRGRDRVGHDDGERPAEGRDGPRQG